MRTHVYAVCAKLVNVIKICLTLMALLMIMTWNRKTVHEQQSRDPSTRQMPVSTHINNCCKTQPKFSIFPFYNFQTDDVSARLAKERFFIDVCSPKLNMF